LLCCCGPLQAWAGERLCARGETVRIAARASRFWRFCRRRGGEDCDLGGRGWRCAPARPASPPFFALD
jgi:hypothetical protein